MYVNNTVGYHNRLWVTFEYLGWFLLFFFAEEESLLTFLTVPLYFYYYETIPLNTTACQGFFFQFWEGSLGPFRLGKVVW